MIFVVTHDARNPAEQIVRSGSDGSDGKTPLRISSIPKLISLKPRIQQYHLNQWLQITLHACDGSLIRKMFQGRYQRATLVSVCHDPALPGRLNPT